ncbi:type I 3-dehydroquinate dehydratase [Weissella bombi]|uniref:type I 3-dehydroquinate dehydratase n=1 Tax=Weissella bombi TaxID=1505725 RepID=UPI003AF2F3DD
MVRLKIGEAVASSERPLIAAPITASTWQQVLQEADILSHSAIDVVEWRIDYLTRLNELTVDHIRQVRQTVMKPVIFTWRTLAEGGNKQYHADMYERIYLNALAAGVVALDIEIDLLKDQKALLKQVPTNVQIIGSKHYFDRTPHNLVQALNNMLMLPTDIVKLAVMPQSTSDVDYLLVSTKQVANDAAKPLITMAMGEMGMPSRILGYQFGSQLTFATVTGSSAPGQVTVSALLQKWGSNHDVQ